MTSVTDYAASDAVASATSGQLATFRLDGDLYGVEVEVAYTPTASRIVDSISLFIVFIQRDIAVCLRYWYSFGLLVWMKRNEL